MVKSIKLVRQQHKMGCLAACISMITQEPYHKIYKIIGDSTLLDAATIVSKYASCNWISIYGVDKKNIPLSILSTGNHAVLWNPKNKKIYDPALDTLQKFENYQYKIIGLGVNDFHNA